MHVSQVTFLSIGLVIVAFIIIMAGVISHYVSDSSGVMYGSIFLAMVSSLAVLGIARWRIEKSGYWDNDLMNSYKQI